MKQKFRTLIGTALIPVFASGCALAAVTAGVGAVKYGNSKQQQVYQEYVSDMEKLNFEREKEKLEIRPIVSYEDWKKGTSPDSGQ